MHPQTVEERLNPETPPNRPDWTKVDLGDKAHFQAINKARLAFLEAIKAPIDGISSDHNIENYKWIEGGLEDLLNEAGFPSTDEEIDELIDETVDDRDDVRRAA